MLEPIPIHRVPKDWNSSPVALFATSRRWFSHVGGLRMSKFKFIIILLLGVLGSAGQAASSATNALAGAYICDEVTALKIHLLIKPDGTYEASLERPAGIRLESGVWTSQKDDLILARRNGDIGHLMIRRLRPDSQISGRLVWIVPGAGSAGGATTWPFFQREVL